MSVGNPKHQTTSQTDLRKVLVLQGPSLESGELVRLLQQHFDVEVTKRFEDALEAMRRTRFEAVLAETADFLPIERGVVTQQAAAVLDTVGDGVCVADGDGRVRWANRRAKGFDAELQDRVSQICRQAHSQLSQQGSAGSAKAASRPGMSGLGTPHDASRAEPSDPVRVRRFSASLSDGRSYEVVCSPIGDGLRQPMQVAAVAIDVTHQRRQQLKLNALDRAGRELVSLERQPAAPRDATGTLRLLEERILGCSREVLNYEHFAILLLEERTNRLELLVCEGMDENVDNYQLLASSEGSGICGYVAAAGRSYICPDVLSDPHYLPGLTDARSSLTVPLRLHDRVVGVLNVESKKPNAFTEEDRQFAEIFGNYIALAMHILNLLATERHSAHCQVTGSLCAELAGPVNDIITEASETMEDYIGHDDLRRRLQRIIDRAAEARKLVQDYSRSPAVLSAGSPGDAKDPVLSGKRVLVADDEQLMRETIRDVLASCGAEVDLAVDGEQARRMMLDAEYDLIITDVKMPGATGYEVFAAARTFRPDARVILITGFGYDPNHSVVRATREGLAAVLSKPFKASKLIQECRSALGNPPA